MTELSIEQCRSSDHHCVCDHENGCRSDSHVCICVKISTVSCLSNYHYCSCDTESPDNCRSSDNHKCICISQGTEKCKSEESHECTCGKTGSKSCKSSTIHECICLTSDQDCKASIDYGKCCPCVCLTKGAKKCRYKYLGGKNHDCTEKQVCLYEPAIDGGCKVLCWGCGYSTPMYHHLELPLETLHQLPLEINQKICRLVVN